MISKLHIKAALRNGKTYLKKAYQTTPLKVLDITEDKGKSDLHLMLMSSSPGVLDGDEYEFIFQVEEGCSLRLSTQSFLRLFNMQKGASQQVEVHLGRHSSIYYIPHPTVPHQASNFTTRSKIYLSEGCELIWGEVLTCGRKLSGEAFKFSRYHSITEVFFNNRLVLKENLLMQPLIVDVTAIGQLEGFTHQASLIYIAEPANINIVIAELRKVLGGYADISFGVSALPINGLIVRMLGYKGEQLHKILTEVAAFLQENKTLAKQVLTVAKDKAYAS